MSIFGSDLLELEELCNLEQLCNVMLNLLLFSLQELLRSSVSCGTSGSTKAKTWLMAPALGS